MSCCGSVHFLQSISGPPLVQIHASLRRLVQACGGAIALCILDSGTMPLLSMTAGQGCIIMLAPYASSHHTSCILVPSVLVCKSTFSGPTSCRLAPNMPQLLISSSSISCSICNRNVEEESVTESSTQRGYMCFVNKQPCVVGEDKTYRHQIEVHNTFWQEHDHKSLARSHLKFQLIQR